MVEKEPLSVEMLETIHKALMVERPGQHTAEGTSALLSFILLSN